MKYNKYLSIILLMMMLSSIASAKEPSDSPDKLFKEGNAAYKNSKYEQAVQDYSKIIEMGIKNAGVYYNLGNAYYKNSKTGYAILNYEKAHRLMPRDSNINYNLDFVRRQVSGSAEANNVQSQFLSDFVSINELSLIVSIIYFAFSVSLVLYVFLKKEEYMWVFATLGFFIVCGFILLGIGIYQNEMIHYGIITAPSAELRSGPNLQESVSSIVTEGTKAMILRKEDDWIEVRISNKSNPSQNSLHGWIPEKDLKEI